MNLCTKYVSCAIKRLFFLSTGKEREESWLEVHDPARS